MGFLKKLFGKKEKDQISSQKKIQEPLAIQNVQNDSEKLKEPENNNVVIDKCKRPEGPDLCGEPTYLLTPEEIKQIDEAFENAGYDKFTNDNEIYEFEFGGVQYHGLEAGSFIVGRTKFEPSNPHDKNAIRLETYEGDLLGYIRKYEQEEYNSLTGKKDELPFIGITYKDIDDDMDEDEIEFLDIEGKIYLISNQSKIGSYKIKDVLKHYGKLAMGRLFYINKNGV